MRRVSNKPMELARILALCALALPGVVYWRRLRKRDPHGAFRYLTGVIGMCLWAFAGSAFMTFAVHEGGTFVVVVAMAFLLFWLSLAIAGFVLWFTPLGMANNTRRPVLMRAIVALLTLAAVTAAVLIVLRVG